jgi:hypothetical protein
MTDPTAWDTVEIASPVAAGRKIRHKKNAQTAMELDYE